MKIKITLECEAIKRPLVLKYNCEEHSKSGLCPMKALLYGVRAILDYCSNDMATNEQELLNGAFELLAEKGGEHLEA